MKELHPDKGLRIFDIKDVKTAGQSPNDNIRTEIFLLGCSKAMNGNPCKNCFNSPTWDKSIAEFSYDPVEFAEYININLEENKRYITIGGGEPSDQLSSLIPFCRKLKEYDFHIIMYTYHKFNEIKYNNKLSKDFNELLNHIDGVIDGEYVEELKIWTGVGNEKSCFVGSSNQQYWTKVGEDKWIVTS